MPVYSLSVTAGNTEVTSFGKGKATVRIPYTLEANEDSNAVVIYYIDGNGAAQVARGAYNSSTKTVDFVSSHFSQYAIGYNKVNFSDVAPDAWYHAAVTFNASRGVVSGTSDVTFRPNAAITRGQFIVMLLRAYGIEPDAGAENNFADAGNTYYTNYLAKAKEMGITTGIGDNFFALEGNITRQDMLTMLYRALDKLEELPEAAKSTNLSDFSDVNLVGDYSRDAITALVQAGVVSGNQGKIEPQGQSTRAQMAQLLYNLLSL